MRFGSPGYLVLLWGLLALAIWVGVLRLRRRRTEESFVRSSLWDELAPARSLVRQRAKLVLRLSGVLFVVLALAEPEWGGQLEMIKRQGVDILVLLDTSLSMAATDLAPNRLARSKQEVRDLIDRLEGDRIAIMPFAGSAYLECPLTLDYGAARMLLEAVVPGTAPRPGTAIAEAIRKGTKVFERRERKHKVAILITDGEDHEGEVKEAAEEAAEEGVIIHTIGVGSGTGELIPLEGTGVDEQGYKKDREGQLVMTRLNEGLLQEIAEITGGTYRRASPGGGELEKVYEIIAGMDKKELSGGSYLRYEARFQYPLMAALILLLIELVLGNRRWRTEVRRRHDLQ